MSSVLKKTNLFPRTVGCAKVFLGYSFCCFSAASFFLFLIFFCHRLLNFCFYKQMICARIIISFISLKQLPNKLFSSSHSNIFCIIAFIIICISNLPAARIRDLAESWFTRISAVYIKCNT